MAMVAENQMESYPDKLMNGPMIPDLTSTLTLAALSAMITPAVLILATGQLILTTSQRLARSMDRARKLSEKLEDFKVKGIQNEVEEHWKLVYSLMELTARRARKLQQAMSALYVTLCIFVCTSVSIGVVEIFGVPYRWIPITFGLAGVGFLFYATILLATEARITSSTVEKEMSYLLKIYAKEGLN